jgi:hypothetical protein
MFPLKRRLTFTGLHGVIARENCENLKPYTPFFCEMASSVWFYSFVVQNK